MFLEIRVPRSTVTPPPALLCLLLCLRTAGVLLAVLLWGASVYGMAAAHARAAEPDAVPVEAAQESAPTDLVPPAGTLPDTAHGVATEATEAAGAPTSPTQHSAPEGAIDPSAAPSGEEKTAFDRNPPQEGTLDAVALAAAAGVGVDDVSLYDGSTYSGVHAARVDANVGSYRYAIPITAPLGRNGLGPDLTLSYDSGERRDSGAFGYGWTSNIPYIERFNRLGVQDLYSRNDFYSSLDGELVWETGNTYRPKYEQGAYRRYVLTNNTWAVYEKNGEALTFGRATSTRQYRPSNPAHTVRWWLEERRDTNGNYAAYAYYAADNELYPESITYTGNGTTPGTYRIEFAREARGDSLVSYAYGYAATTSYRISTIQVRANGVPVRSYALAYGTGANGTRSLLTSVTETGYDESTGTATPLPERLFSYTNGGDRRWTSLECGAPIPFTGGGDDAGVRFGDVNGDGLVDILYAARHGSDASINVIYLNQGGHCRWATSTLTVPLPPGNSTGFVELATDPNRDQGGRVVDVNGDGLADVLWYTSGGGSYAYLNTGNGWTEQDMWRAPQFMAINGRDAGVLFEDVNGDGLTDFLKSWQEAGVVSPHKFVYFNTGSGWAQAPSSWDIPTLFVYGSGDRGVRVFDMNGDGLADIAQGMFDSQYDPDLNINTVWLNTGSGWASSTYSLPVHFVSGGRDNNARLADLNGDGLEDILRLTSENYSRRLYLNTGTGWYEATSWLFPSNLIFSGSNGDTGLRLLDLNGDAVFDLSMGASGTWRFDGAKVDLLERVALPEGGSLGVSYKQTPLYTGADGMTLLNSALPLNLDTVSTLTEEDGRGGVAVTSYTYGGGVYATESIPHRFAGFATTTVTDPLGNKTATYYHQGNGSQTALGEYQDHPAKVGKPYRIEQYGSANDLYRTTVNRWDRFALNATSSFVKLASTTELTYDGDSDHRDTATSYTYDNTTGNVTNATEYGEVSATTDGSFTDSGTDKRTTDYTYAASSTGWLIVPKQETLKNSAGTTVADTKYYYDTLAFGAVYKGNRTKSERWVSGTAWVNDQKAYNSYGLVTSETDPRGKVTTYTYDAYNLFPATTTNPLGHATYRQYDLSSGKVVKLKDPQGLWYESVYDGLDRVTTEKQPDTLAPSTLVTKTRYEYTDTRGETRVKRTDELDTANARDAYQYFDGLGRLVQTRTEGEEVSAYVTTDRGYNERGQLKTESLPYFSAGTASTSPTVDTALLTCYTYDALGRPNSLVNAAGTTTYAYDQWETVVTDPNGHPRDLHRDAYDRLAKVEEHNAAATYTTLYDYDALDNLTKVTDAASNIRAFAYDGLSRRTRAEDLHANGDTTYGVYLFAYDAAGNVSSTTNPRGQAVAYTYDNGNRVLTEDHLGQSGTEVSYRYDTCTYGKGRLCIATSTGAVTSYTYDALGRMATETKKIAGISYATGYRYDRTGALTALTYPDRSEVRYLYDASGRLDAIERKELGQSPLTLERYLTYTPTDALEYEEYGDGSYVYSGYDSAERYRLRYRANVAYDTGTWGSGVAAMGGAEDAAAPAGLTAARARYAAYGTAAHGYDGASHTDTALPTVYLPDGVGASRTLSAPERAYYARTRTAALETQPVRSHAAPLRTADSTRVVASSGAAMASLLASVNPPAASQHMRVEGAWRTTTITDNRSFEAGTDRWTYWGDSGSTLGRDCTSASNGSCSFKVYSASPGNEWDVVLEQEGLRIDPGVTYRIVFDAKANATSSLYSLVGQDHAPWYTYGHATFVTVTPQWKTYTYTFRSTATTSDERSVLYFGFGQGQGTFNVDNVRLVPDDQDLIRNPSFEGGTIGGWYFGGAGATSSVPCVGAPDGVCAMKATLTQAGQYWAVEFSHGGMAVATGTTYLFSFDAKAAAARTLYVELGQAHAPWNLLAPTVVVPLTSTWTHYVFKLTANASDTNARIGFYMGNSTTSLWLDNVRFAEAVPTKVTDMTPEFSARYDDPDAGDTATSYRVQVDYTWGDFSAPVWDSGKLTMASVPEGVRTADLSYAGPTLYPDGTRYRWRIKLWDESGNEGPYTNGEDYFYTAGDKVQQATYAYDPAGNITQIVDDVEGATGKNQVYTYDDLDRLTGASVGSAWPHYVNGRFSAAAPGASIRSYTYSPLGNITSASDLGTYTYAGTGYANPHALTSVSGQTYTYDNAGNVTADGTRTNTWDYQSRLTQTLKSGTTYRSTYDHAGQRTAYYDGTATTTFPNKYYEQRGGVVTKHLYRPDGTLIATVTGTGTAATLRYIHTDHLGGTKAVTDANGRVEMLDYYPYGGTRVDEQSSSYAERRKYIGGEYDTGTGLYYLEARYQNPVTGRFVSQDPSFLDIGAPGFGRRYERTLEQHLMNPQALNSYSYGLNNPITHKDPEGEIVPLVIAGVWAVAELGLTAYDAYNAYQTANDPNATNLQKSVAVSGFAAGLIAPGGGYGVAGKSLVGQSFGKVGTVIENASAKITGFTTHGFNQTINRSVNPSLLLDTTKNAAVTLKQAGGNVLYLTNKAGVVLNKAGEVVTSYTSKDFKPHIVNILKKAAEKKK